MAALCQASLSRETLGKQEGWLEGAEDAAAEKYGGWVGGKQYPTLSCKQQIPHLPQTHTNFPLTSRASWAHPGTWLAVPSELLL